MSPRSSATLAIVATLFATSICSTARADGEEEDGIGRVMRTPVPARLVYELRPISTAPARGVIEHEALQLRYTLKVSKSAGIVDRPLTVPVLRVCPAFQVYGTTTCNEYRHAALGRTYTGTIQAVAPAAGISAALMVVAEESVPLPSGAEFPVWERVAWDTIRMPVAARYEVALTAFDVLHTRARSTDTVWSNLQAMVKAVPAHASEREDACKLEGFRWCSMQKKFGDAQDGVHRLRDVRVGPFELVPEREDALKILYTIYNQGESYDAKVAEAVANGFSKVGMVLLMAYGAQSGNSTTSVAEALDAEMQALHAALTAGCDGLSAVDVRVFTNVTLDHQDQATLDGLTRATGAYTPPFTDIYENGEYTDGNTICGAGGKYRVQYAVYRTSWKDWP